MNYRALEQRRREDDLKLKALRVQIKAGIDAIKRGDFAEIEEADLASESAASTLTLTDGAFSSGRAGTSRSRQYSCGERGAMGNRRRRRYVILLHAAMRMIAADPEGPLTRARKELAPGVRSFHLRHARGNAPQASI